MRVRISTLPPQGLQVCDSLPLETLNARLNEGHSTDIKFLSPPQANLLALPVGTGATVTGTVTGQYQQDCGRCSDPVPQQMEIQVNLIARPRAEGSDVEDDIGIVFFDGEHVELGDLLEELLILKLDLFWSPPMDESNKCTVCSRQLVKGESKPVNVLGDLLKKAGVQ
jgi:uncharacterized metal-binding protein YceD (DUF177 family)